MKEAEYSPEVSRRMGFITLRRGVIIGLFLVPIMLWIYAGSESRQTTEDRFKAALVEQVIPEQQIQLHGNIFLRGFRTDRAPDESVEQERGNIRVFRFECDAKCAALLALPEVESVTIVGSGPTPRVTRFRLVNDDVCSRPSIVPQAPDALRSLLPTRAEPDRPELDHHEKMQAGIVSARIIETSWRIRLSAGECILADQQIAEPDFTIEVRTERQPDGYLDPEDWKWTFDQRPLTDHQFEIRDGRGTVVLRRQFVIVPILARPIHPGFVASCGDLCAYLGWARTNLANYESDERDRQNDAALLLEHTNLARGIELSILRVDAGSIAASLRAALNDANRPFDDPAFGLVDSWMRSLNQASLTEADVELLVDLIGDDRVINFLGMWHVSRVLGPRVAELENPIRQRIARDFGRPEVVKPLSAQLDSVAAQASPEVLAEGPSKADLEILNDPEKRLHARGLIERQSAYGAGSVPLLMKIIREHMERTQDAREQSPEARISAEIGPIDAAMVALCRLGPEAKSAVPEILALRGSWLNRYFTSERRWQLSLARIGVPLSSITKPEGLTRMTQEDYEEGLRRKLANFVANRDCKGSWS